MIIPDILRAYAGKNGLKRAIIPFAGLVHPRDLQPHHLYTRISATESLPIDRAWHFLDDNHLIDAPEKTLRALVARRPRRRFSTRNPT